MEDIKLTIAKNISDLRKKHKLTQAELAEKLNYSDKAVSKWERGESIPDVAVLKIIANLFNVSVDFLLTEDHSDYIPVQKKLPISRRNRNLITLLSVSLVWFLATAVFSFTITVAKSFSYDWTAFIYAIPCSLVVMLVFNCIWGSRKKLNFMYISFIIWSVLLCVYLTCLLFFNFNFWALFIIGIPAQLIVILWSGLSFKKR